MKRNIDIELLKWKKTSQRKVLLIRGTRQIGKTYAIRKLGETFKHFIEINFEEEPQLGNLFSGSLNPTVICKNIADYYEIPIIPGKTLLFFDCFIFS